MRSKMPQCHPDQSSYVRKRTDVNTNKAPTHAHTGLNVEAHSPHRLSQDACAHKERGTQLIRRLPRGWGKTLLSLVWPRCCPHVACVPACAHLRACPGPCDSSLIRCITSKSILPVSLIYCVVAHAGCARGPASAANTGLCRREAGLAQEQQQVCRHPSIL